MAGRLFELGKGLEHNSSLTRHGNVGGVGVKGWKLGIDVGGREELGGIESSSFWRSLILCKSSFRYSMASPRIEALSICQKGEFTTHVKHYKERNTIYRSTRSKWSMKQVVVVLIICPTTFILLHQNLNEEKDVYKQLVSFVCLSALFLHFTTVQRGHETNWSNKRILPDYESWCLKLLSNLDGN